MNVGGVAVPSEVYIKPALTAVPPVPLDKCVATILPPLDDIEMLVYLRSFAGESVFESVLIVAHAAP